MSQLHMVMVGMHLVMVGLLLGLVLVWLWMKINYDWRYIWRRWKGWMCAKQSGMTYSRLESRHYAEYHNHPVWRLASFLDRHGITNKDYTW